MEKTKSEMWDFLKALHDHGSNVDALLVALPGWTKDHIEHVMKRFRHRANRKLASDEGTTRDSSLNLWVKIVENLHQLQGSTNHPWWRKGRQKMDEEPKDHAPTLSKILLHIAKYEKHYQGPGLDDPNYVEIYRYLSQLVEGDEPTQLSPGSAAKILEMVNKIKKVVTDESVLKYHRYLQNVEVSYLPSVPNVAPNMFAKRKASSMEENSSLRGEDTNEEDSVCPLYEDEEREDVCLEPSDPYYDLKREKMTKKIKTTQYQEASNLHRIPGLNPMEIPPELLVKPACSLLDP